MSSGNSRLNLEDVFVIPSGVSPVNFAVPCTIDGSTVGGWLQALTGEFKDHMAKVQGWEIFPGKSVPRKTARGLLSANAGPSTTGKEKTDEKEQKSRFMTIGKEVKAAARSLISLLATELALSIVYIHHRAFELDDILCQTEETIGKFNESALAPEEERKRYIQRWAENFEFYLERHEQDVNSDLKEALLPARSMVNSENVASIRSRLHTIRDMLKAEFDIHGRNTPVVISSASMCILLKHKDVHYPYGKSFFEIAKKVSDLGLAKHCIAEMARECRKGEMACTITDKYDGIKKRIQEDLRANLLPTLASMNERMKADVILESVFFEQAATIIADFIVFFSLAMFRVSAACTDGRVGTTINNRMVQTIFSQIPTDGLMTLSRLQMTIVENIVVHAIVLSKRTSNH